MSRWHDDKGMVKDVFDCIRNYLICGAVFLQAFMPFSERLGSQSLNGLIGRLALRLS